VQGLKCTLAHLRNSSINTIPIQDANVSSKTIIIKKEVKNGCLLVSFAMVFNYNTRLDYRYQYPSHSLYPY
jgi:hypothetical protein